MPANTKKMIDKLKILFTQEISASAVKVTSSANYTLSRKLNQLSARLRLKLNLVI